MKIKKEIWFLGAVSVFVLYLLYKKGAVKGTVQQVVNESEKKDGNKQTITEFSEPKLANDVMYKPREIIDVIIPKDGKGVGSDIHIDRIDPALFEQRFN